MSISRTSGAGADPRRQESMNQQLHRLKKERLEKKVYEDPAAFEDLLKTEAAGTYNSTGTIAEEVRGDLGRI
ncbi:MAG: hypothetical protein ACNI27_02310 [Desulfovibrio sp.]